MNFFSSALVHREPVACTGPKNGLNVPALDHSIRCANILRVGEQGISCVWHLRGTPKNIVLFALQFPRDYFSRNAILYAYAYFPGFPAGS